MHTKRSVIIQAHIDVAVYTVTREKLVQVKSVELEGCLTTGYSVTNI